MSDFNYFTPLLERIFGKPKRKYKKRRKVSKHGPEWATATTKRRKKSK